MATLAVSYLILGAAIGIAMLAINGEFETETDWIFSVFIVIIAAINWPIIGLFGSFYILFGREDPPFPMPEVGKSYRDKYGHSATVVRISKEANTTTVFFTSSRGTNHSQTIMEWWESDRFQCFKE